MAKSKEYYENDKIGKPARLLTYILAVLEGVAFAIRDNFEIARQQGIEKKRKNKIEL